MISALTFRTSESRQATASAMARERYVSEANDEELRQQELEDSHKSESFCRS